MGVAWRETGWKRVSRLGRQEPHKCSQDRMQMYPDCSASDPGRSQKGVQRQQQRKDRSIVFQFMQLCLCTKIYAFQHENSQK